MLNFENDPLFDLLVPKYSSYAAVARILRTGNHRYPPAGSQNTGQGVLELR